MAVKNLSENLRIGAMAYYAYEVILDGLYPPPFMKNMGEAAKDEFDRIFERAMDFLYGDADEC